VSSEITRTRQLARAAVEGLPLLHRCDDVPAPAIPDRGDTVELGTPPIAFHRFSCILIRWPFTVDGVRYLVKRRLGEGGFASVLSAVREDDSSPIALKWQRGSGVWELYIFSQLDQRMPSFAVHITPCCYSFLALCCF
jgi:hypothetical protein